MLGQGHAHSSKPLTTWEDIAAKCHRDFTFDCMLWSGRLGSNGRPLVFVRGKPTNVHVIAFKLVNGPIPAGYVIDHICRAPTCVRPLHLEATTRDENELRKVLHYRLKRKACPRKHPLTDRTRLLSRAGGILCRTCIAEDKQEFRP